MAGSISSTSVTDLTDASSYTKDAAALGFVYLGGSGTSPVYEYKASAGNITVTTGNVDGGPGASGGVKVNWTGGDGTITGSGTGTNQTTNCYANPGTGSPPFITMALESTAQVYRVIGGYSSGNTTSQNHLSLKITPSDGSFSVTRLNPTIKGGNDDTDVLFEFTAQGNSNGQTVKIEFDEFETSTVAYKSLRWAEFKASASGSTGTVAITNANDAPSAAGTTTVTGTNTTTNANDSTAISGTTTVLGASSTTNASDTSAASGTSTVPGASATTNADDAATASGSVGSAVSGASATTNADDAAAAQGTTELLGTSATTNINDSCNATGVAGAVSGTADVTSNNDSSNANGATPNSQQNSGGYGNSFESWNPVYLVNRKRRELQKKDIPKVAKKAIQEVAKLNLPNNEAEIALRLRTQQIQWQAEYLSYLQGLQDAQQALIAHENEQLNSRLRTAAFKASYQAKIASEMEDRQRRIQIIMQLI